MLPMPFLGPMTYVLILSWPLITGNQLLFLITFYLIKTVSVRAGGEQEAQIL